MLKFKSSNYQHSADIFKAMGHTTRLWIVEQLSDHNEHCVCEFVDAIDVDFSTISKHLAVLKNAGVITDEKRGKWVYYKLLCPSISKAIKVVDNCKP